MSERVIATVSIELAAEVNGRKASVSPDYLEVDLTDLFRSRAEPLARQMMPMKIEQAAGEIARRMFVRLGVQP